PEHATHACPPSSPLPQVGEPSPFGTCRSRSLPRPIVEQTSERSAAALSTCCETPNARLSCAAAPDAAPGRPLLPKRSGAAPRRALHTTAQRARYSVCGGARRGWKLVRVGPAAAPADRSLSAEVSFTGSNAISRQPHPAGDTDHDAGAPTATSTPAAAGSAAGRGYGPGPGRRPGAAGVRR